MILDELKKAGHDQDTLIIYTSDNGIPFPNGRTNLYDPGLAEPMFISSPVNTKRRNQVTHSLTSLLDVTPTILDWFDIKIPKEIDNNIRTSLTGKSLLPLLDKGNNKKL